MLSIAPMMGYTDRHFRRFFRLISRSTVLYTEMVSDAAILFGSREKFLGHVPAEHPLVLQLGGSNPDRLAECARIAADWGFDAVNLNCGCPSEKVEQGSFGACLMASPARVEGIVRGMVNAGPPVSVKHRLGIRGRGAEGREEFSHLREFVEACAAGGCRHFIVHARIAILGGLSPVENRLIPPLDTESVYRLKQEFPSLRIELNGGVRSLDEAALHLRHVDGVMIGRAACDDPWMFHCADSRFFGQPDTAGSRKEVVRRLAALIPQGEPYHHLLRHAANLFTGLYGARRFRRFLSENIFVLKARDHSRIGELLEEAMVAVVEPPSGAHLPP